MCVDCKSTLLQALCGNTYNILYTFHDFEAIKYPLRLFTLFRCMLLLLVALLLMLWLLSFGVGVGGVVVVCFVAVVCLCCACC